MVVIHSWWGNSYRNNRKLFGGRGSKMVVESVLKAGGGGLMKPMVGIGSTALMSQRAKKAHRTRWPASKTPRRKGLA